MKIYCTKWIFTNGIMELDAETDGKNMVRVLPKSGEHYGYYLYGEGKEWHKKKESAIAYAEKMRIKKIKSLDKQMKKISEMKFD